MQVSCFGRQNTAKHVKVDHTMRSAFFEMDTSHVGMIKDAEKC
jgi:hypothetical protein